MADQVRNLILTPAEFPAGIKGAVQIDADCGHQAWISPSGMTALLSTRMRTVCLRCVPRGTIQTEALPGARDELAANIGAERADQIIEAVHRMARRGHRWN